MVNFTSSKIYKIIDNTNGNIYIGSTTNTLSRRLSEHKSHYKQYLEGKRRNCKSYDILANGDYDIILLEKCENITSKDELHARERHYIDTLECVNKNIPGRTKKEYYQNNKEEIKEKVKEYYEDNREKIKQYQKEYIKEWYEMNKEQLKQYASEKLLCPHCLCEFSRGNKTHHQRSKKHQQAHIENLN